MEKLLHLHEICYQVYTETNAHRVNGESPAEYLTRIFDMVCADLGILPEGWEEWRSLCVVDIYPYSAAGSYSYYGPTLADCLDQISPGDVEAMEAEIRRFGWYL